MREYGIGNLIARNILPDPFELQTHQFTIHNYMNLLKTYQDGISAFERQMESLAQAFSAYHLLRSIPGVGPITAAMIHADIGDIKRCAFFMTLKPLTYQILTLIS